MEAQDEDPSGFYDKQRWCFSLRVLVFAVSKGKPKVNHHFEGRVNLKNKPISGGAKECKTKNKCLPELPRPKEKSGSYTQTEGSWSGLLQALLSFQKFCHNSDAQWSWEKQGILFCCLTF